MVKFSGSVTSSIARHGDPDVWREILFQPIIDFN